jgi:carbonic anhydrase
MAHGKFATAVNCMDGRVQLPVIEYMRKKFGVDFVDSVTEAGADGILGHRSARVTAIKKRVEISVKKHGSRVVAVVGHHDCAGNPVSKETHIKEIKDDVKIVSEWFPGVKVVGLWVGEDWKVREVC